jgi:4-carboxymuconolactone decarboxylase
MTPARDADRTVEALDGATRQLVRLAAVVAVGSEAEVRDALGAAAAAVPAAWVEELILQSYLFAGFPRTLNAMREWRRLSGRRAPGDDEGAQLRRVEDWQRRGEATCAAVYGAMYDRLRVNIRKLHPALDAWMVAEGYGKVLGRPGLDLKRRELCIVAVCAAARQERQLHSHLHGALNVGAAVEEVDAALAAVADLVTAEERDRMTRLWERVKNE